MSSQETIRVLEVVDGSLQTNRDVAKTSEVTEQASESGPGQEVQSVGRETGLDGLPAHEVSQLEPSAPTQVKSTVVPVAPVIQTVAASVPACLSIAQPPAPLPITVPASPQMLTQDNLATVLTGMMTPAGAVSQPLLIPLSMSGQIAGQQGLAVLTFPTATVATLPGLTAVSPAGGLLKLPIAGLQAATVLNAVQPHLHTATPTILQTPAAALQPPATMQPIPQPTQQTVIQTTGGAPTLKLSESQASVATLQTAGISINPAIISAASLGAQPQFISSLATTPIITSTISGMQSLTSQIITNAQGQVIGTLPFLVNPASLSTAAAAPAALSAQGLQVQTVTPQLLLNAQGQIIATIGNGPPQTAIMAKPNGSPQLPAKPVAQIPAVTAVPVSQAPVVIAPQPTPAKTVAAISTPCTISGGDTPTVGQLVNKPQGPVVDEDGINLEEIREFAKNFKIRRLSLGLTQTQVGQALTATEGPAYSQSAICRFEKLDITPKSAQKLKPVLEKWLAEAELWNQKGQQNLMEFVGGEPSKKRKRRTSFTPQAIEVLNTYFEKNALPTGQEITEIAKELNYDREVVRVWFCNRRQTLKNTSKLNVFQIQ
ncbi:POU domain, class 6, transcription factor 1 isoform X2 [Erpetoichthys calabaricus]|uniref:POU domain protein n=2 Tax=Erpetoichthys calabaricus TaxID=27687 RepID=A0A8C4RWL2_ERPCA|nr:POU domain, class 6, transcription factor 1 isoform X2 [Erpetoichthys calabaricus]